MFRVLVVVAFRRTEAVAGSFVALAVSVAVLITGIVGGIVVLSASIARTCVRVPNAPIRISRILSRVAAAAAVVIVTFAPADMRAAIEAGLVAVIIGAGELAILAMIWFRVELVAVLAIKAAIAEAILPGFAAFFIVLRLMVVVVIAMSPRPIGGRT